MAKTSFGRHCLSRGNNTAKVKQVLNELRAKHDIIIADTPGGLDPQTVALVRHADIVVLPVKASPLDIFSAMTLARKLITTVKKKFKIDPVVRFVINELDRRTKFGRQVRKHQKKMSPPATKGCVRYLDGFKQSVDQGTFPTRLTDRKAIADLDAVFGELMKEVNKQTKRKAGNG